MRVFFALAVLFFSTSIFAQRVNQLELNLDAPNLEPGQEVSWRVMAGSTAINATDGDYNRSGTGLGIGAEKMMTNKFSVGFHYANIKSHTSSGAFSDYNYETGAYNRYETRESLNVYNIYGKFAFIHYPIDDANLVQVNLLGGLMDMDYNVDKSLLVYGASASYNFDNVIGFEISTKVNLRSNSITTANLIGYF